MLQDTKLLAQLRYQYTHLKHHEINAFQLLHSPRLIQGVRKTREHNWLPHGRNFTSQFDEKKVPTCHS